MTNITGTQSRLRVERLRQVLKVLPGNIAMSLALAAAVLAMVWPGATRRSALLWAGLMLAVSGWRLLIYNRYRRRLATDSDEDLLQLAWDQRAASLAAGSVWAASLLLLWRPEELVPQLFLVVLLAGVTSAAATSLAVELISALLFQLPIFLALGLRLFSDGEFVTRSIGVTVLLYGMFTLLAMRRLSSSATENITLRLEALQGEALLLDSESRYHEQAQRDSLTGLGNRFAIQILLPPQLESAAAAGVRVALLCIDLDNFKDINDTRGHGCGDELLQLVAARLRSAVRDEDEVFRIGGDEFLVVTHRCVEQAELEQMAGRLRSELARPLELSGEPASISASVGIGVFPDHGTDIETLLKHADVALHDAKEQGRNDFRFYSAAQSLQIAERLAVERALGDAIRNEQIFLEFQPLVNLDTGNIVGAEALARWRHPERGLIAPTLFIAAAERSGQIEALGELLLNQLCRQLRSWLGDMVPVVPMAINVSPRQLDTGRFTRLFEAATRRYEIDPGLIDIEVTESALIDHGQGHQRALGDLQRLGARVSIDDFGTGYSSLSYLKNLPIDCVKIDKSFVRDMLNDRRDAAIVSAIVTIGHSLGLRVVAEGVESRQQAQQLKSLGCDAAQGFYYYRPVSGQQLAALLVADVRRLHTSVMAPESEPAQRAVLLLAKS